MKKPIYPKFLSEIYKEAGYSNEIIANIEMWESQHPSVDTLLEEYRYVQPNGELFSECSLKIITVLHDMKSMLEAQKELICDIETKLKTFVKWTFKQKNELDDFGFKNELF